MLLFVGNQGGRRPCCVNMQNRAHSLVYIKHALRSSQCKSPGKRSNFYLGYLCRFLVSLDLLTCACVCVPLGRLHENVGFFVFGSWIHLWRSNGPANSRKLGTFLNTHLPDSLVVVTVCTFSANRSKLSIAKVGRALQFARNLGTFDITNRSRLFALDILDLFPRCVGTCIQ